MICPVQLASDLSAEGDEGKRHSVSRRQDAKILSCRLGAGDEGTRSDLAGDGEENYVVASGGDCWSLGPQHAALAAALRGCLLYTSRCV